MSTPGTCELNPTELAWVRVKRHLMEYNVTDVLTFKTIQEMIGNAEKSITGSDGKDGDGD